MKRLVLTLAALALSVQAALAGAIPLQGFNSIGTLGAAGWVFINNSSPAGTTGWFQGNDGIFPAYGGASDSYIAANFLNAAVGGNISNWLLTPNVTIDNGDVFSFFTRSTAVFQDRLELRMSKNGASTNVGASDVSVGDFTTLLLTINPALDFSYPGSWTQFSATVSGLAGPTSGRFGLRYGVPDTSSNGDYIGIDDVELRPVPEPALLLLLGTGIAGLAARRRRKAL